MLSRALIIIGMEDEHVMRRFALRNATTSYNSFPSGHLHDPHEAVRNVKCKCDLPPPELKFLTNKQGLNISCYCSLPRYCLNCLYTLMPCQTYMIHRTLVHATFCIDDNKQTM